MKSDPPAKGLTSQRRRSGWSQLPRQWVKDFKVSKGDHGVRARDSKHIHQVIHSDHTIHRVMQLIAMPELKSWDFE